MKKIIFIALSFLLTIQTFAQVFQSYVMIRSGLTSNNTYGLGYSVQGEYGKTYKWFDIGLSMEYFSTLPIGGIESGNISKFNNNSFYSGFQGLEELSGKYTTSISIHPMFNIVKLFNNRTNHCFKIGTSIGILHSTSINKEFTNGNSIIRYESKYIFNYFPLDIQYEYIMKNNICFGSYLKTTVYSSTYLLGLSVKRLF